MGHDADFAKFREDRAREREDEVRVTWRRVSKDTGGGYSGLGPNGLLVYVAPTVDPAGRGQHDYGRVEGTERIKGGSRMSLNEAKRTAELLMRRMAGKAPYQRCPKCGMAAHAPDRFCKTDNAATAAEGGTMSDTSTAAGRRANSEARQAELYSINLTEALAEGIGEVAGTEKGSIRILANGHRLAYVNPRKDSIRLDISARDVEEAPARFQKMMGDTDKRGYRALNVTAKNLKGARALMEWIAKQTA